MTPPRHVLVHVPPGKGLTRANLNRITRLETLRNNRLENGNHNNARAISNELDTIYNRIARNGGHANANAARGFVRRYINKLGRLHIALIRAVPVGNISRVRDVKAWRRVQGAAGRFKKGGMMRKLRTLTEALGGGHNAYTMGQLVGMRISSGSPTTTRRNYNAAVRREEERAERRAANIRRRESAARHAEQLARMRRPSPPRASTTTRSGRTSTKPRP